VARLLLQLATVITKGVRSAECPPDPNSNRSFYGLSLVILTRPLTLPLTHVHTPNYVNTLVGLPLLAAPQIVLE